MTTNDLKDDLHHYLCNAREAVVWKLEDLDEYGGRRPMTPTGTNLLGLVKHLSGVEMLYFGFVFDRPVVDPPGWFGPQMDPNADMWTRTDEARTEVLQTYRRACAHADETIAALDLDTVGFVPWLPDGRMTLHRVLVHVLAETERHAGHADIVRELIDGAVGRTPQAGQMNPGNADEPPRDARWWVEYSTIIERNALAAGGRIHP
jgi:Protein of unknown function (DUF664)